MPYQESNSLNGDYCKERMEEKSKSNLSKMKKKELAKNHLAVQAQPNKILAYNWFGTSCFYN